MQASLQLRASIAVVGALAAGLVFFGYAVLKFHSYDSQVSRMFSGDHKSIIAGNVLEANVKAAEALTGSPEFAGKFRGILDEVKAIAPRDFKYGPIEEAKQNPDDLFTLYRNVKTTAFNLYRSAWSNRWMNVAQSAGLILGDLESFPHDDGAKAVAGVNAKIAHVTSFVTAAGIPQAAKLAIFNHLTALKNQIAKYSQAIARAEAIRGARLEVLKSVSTLVRSHNEAQVKKLAGLGSGSSYDFFKAVGAFLLFLSFAVAWFWGTMRAFARHVARATGDVVRQLSGWISPSGAATISGIVRPQHADVELAELYEALDAAVKRVNLLRKEDVAVKRLLGVPFTLVSHAQKKAVYWNSALCILGKVRAVDESGPVPYPNVLRFSDVHGRALDPVERCFSESREIGQLALFKSGQEGIACQVTCIPVPGESGDAEYVMVQVRDLRDENRRLEAELDRQLECVREAAAGLREGIVPLAAPSWTRRPIVETVAALRHFTIEKTEKFKIHAGQLRASCGRYEREGAIKDSVHKRMIQAKAAASGLHDASRELSFRAEAIRGIVGGIVGTGNEILAHYDEIRRKCEAFSDDLGRSKTLLGWCMQEMKNAEELTKKVRAHEKTIEALMRKATLLSVNNGIMESGTPVSGRELTPEQLMMITENLNDILIQFNRAYRMIETSVRELEGGYRDAGAKIRDQLKAAAALVSNDRAIVECVRESEKTIAEEREEIEKLGVGIGEFVARSGKLAVLSQSLEHKTSRLVEIGEASMALHTQLEKGLREASMRVEAELGASKLEGQAEHVAPVLKNTGVS